MWFSEASQTRADERHKETSEQRCTAIKTKKKSAHLLERGGDASVFWPKDAQTPAGLTRHVHLQRAVLRPGPARTYRTRQLRAQPEEQQQQRPAGGKGTRSRRGEGTARGGGGRARHSPCAPHGPGSPRGPAQRSRLEERARGPSGRAGHGAAAPRAPSPGTTEHRGRRARGSGRAGTAGAARSGSVTARFPRRRSRSRHSQRARAGSLRSPRRKRRT